MSRKLRADYDAVWKEALEQFFPDFMQFFLPQAYAAIDWAQGPEFLEQELRSVLGKRRGNKLAVDKLAKVQLLGGGEEWVLVHVEVQSQPDANFAQRMLIYHVRIYEKFGHLVCDVAVLADSSRGWRPSHFGHSLWGTDLQFDYVVSKLTDYYARWDELEASDNPFAVIVMAHLKSQETQPDSRTRLVERLHLERKLRSIGLKKEDTSNLMTLVDGLMKLDSALESELYAIVAAEEAEESMALTNYIERRGHQRGFEEGLLQGEIEGKAEGLLTAIKLSLQLMHGDPGVDLYAEVAKIKDPARLEDFYARLIGGATLLQLQEFCQIVR